MICSLIPHSYQACSQHRTFVNLCQKRIEIVSLNNAKADALVRGLWCQAPLQKIENSRVASLYERRVQLRRNKHAKNVHRLWRTRSEQHWIFLLVPEQHWIFLRVHGYDHGRCKRLPLRRVFLPIHGMQWREHARLRRRSKLCSATQILDMVLNCGSTRKTKLRLRRLTASIKSK